MAKVNWDYESNFSEGVVPLQQPAATPTEQEPLYRSSFANSGGVVIPLKEVRSSNFEGNSAGWILNRNGLAEFNGNAVTSTNFTQVLKCKGVSIVVSDGTTPNGNLSGVAGDLCLNGPSGQPFKCTSGTTWVGL